MLTFRLVIKYFICHTAIKNFAIKNCSCIFTVSLLTLRQNTRNRSILLIDLFNSIQFVQNNLYVIQSYKNFTGYPKNLTIVNI